MQSDYKFNKNEVMMELHFAGIMTGTNGGRDGEGTLSCRAFSIAILVRFFMRRCIALKRFKMLSSQRLAFPFMLSRFKHVMTFGIRLLKILLKSLLFY